MQTGAAGKEVFQVGILVKDVEHTAEKLEQLLGIGPFRVFEPEYRNLSYRGKRGRFKVRIGLAKAGPILIELAQPISRETIYDEFAKRKEYGLHHLGIRTDNMQESVKEMENKGFRVIQSGNRPGSKWAFLDTEEKIGLIFELIEWKE